MSTPTCCDVDDFLRVLADETRQKILKLLQDGEMSVQELTDQIGLTQSTISYHLARMQNVKLVNARHAGRQKFYRSNPACVARCSHAILERITPAAAWPTTIAVEEKSRSSES